MKPWHMWLRVSFVQRLADPLDWNPWGCVGRVTRPMVARARPVADAYSDHSDEWTAWRHAGRIRYLVERGWADAIQIDVGCPVLG